MWDELETELSSKSAVDGYDSLFQSSVWYEKYRPKTLDEMILPDYIKDKLRVYISDGGKTMPHLGLFSRLPGTGKSSLAKVLMRELNAEALWINSSLERGIDILRTRIQQFASQTALRDCVKIVVMDEFDGFSKEGQAAFRGFIDNFGGNVRFIFTGNFKENIIEPLLDRLEVYDFNNFGPAQIAKPILSRLEYILAKENVQYERDDLLKVIKSNFPKIRSMIGALGAGLHTKEDGTKVFEYSYVGDSNKLDELMILMKQKDINKVRTLVYGLGSCDHIFGYLGEHIELIFGDKQEALINGVIALAKYQSYHSSAKDKQLNALACCFELMRLL
jgi:DNA polymerase III delta prime subunit|nr:MAG TPA: activator clamp loader [Myoviridae sp. ctTS62]